MANIIHVAVGAIIGSDGNVLIAKRPDHVHQGGLWEFPGGKVEQGETVFAALKRELHEELAIEILASEPLIKIRHTYCVHTDSSHTDRKKTSDKTVLLEVHKVKDFKGDPRGNEGQPIAWVAPSKLQEYAFPAANRPIVTALNLPNRYMITGAFTSDSDFLWRSECALKAGIRCIQMRVLNLSSATFFVLMEKLVTLCDAYLAKLIINTSPENFSVINNLYPQLGLHLSSQHLMCCSIRPVVKSVLLGASCHNEEEILQAKKISADYILLSPVAHPRSHPSAAVIGWERLEQLIDIANMPVFALGGMSEINLAQAIMSGAQGIAGITEWWDK